MIDRVELKKFKEIDINDPFFNSLKNSYSEFVTWFNNKSDEQAFVIKDDIGFLQGFVYLKIELGELTDITPPLSSGKYLKIGTLKINAHGTHLGAFFINKAIDYANANSINSVYATVFSDQVALIGLFEKFGFKNIGCKITHNGTEDVFLKEISGVKNECITIH